MITSIGGMTMTGGNQSNRRKACQPVTLSTSHAL